MSENIKIEVLPRKPELFESTWEGVTRQRSRQWAVITIDSLPTSFAVVVEPGKEYPPGEYFLGAESFGVANGRLSLSRVVLKPIKAEKGGQNTVKASQ